MDSAPLYLKKMLQIYSIFFIVILLFCILTISDAYTKCFGRMIRKNTLLKGSIKNDLLLRTALGEKTERTPVSYNILLSI